MSTFANCMSDRWLTRPPYDHLGSFSAALRENTPADLPASERLYYFFEIFPEVFRTYRRSNQVLGIWYMQATGPYKPQVKPDPYRYAGLRDVGTTSHMIIEVGRAMRMPVCVLHNEQKLYDFIPEGYKEQGTTESGKRN